MPPTPSKAQQGLLAANSAFEAGNIPLAEVLAWESLDREPSEPAGWNLLGRVAMSLGRPDKAAAWFERALACGRSFKPAAKNLAAAQAALADWTPERTKLSDGRYLLILPWGQGFWSDVDHVLGACLTAEMTGRKPVVFWGPGSRFRDAQVENAWTEFFEPVSGASVASAVAAAGEADGAGVFPGKWRGADLLAGPRNQMVGPESCFSSLRFFGRSEAVCVSDAHTDVFTLIPWLEADNPEAGADSRRVHRRLVKHYLRPSARAQGVIDEFVRTTLRPPGSEGPLLAVHIRGSDKIVEDRQAYERQRGQHERVRAFLARDARARVFLLTDTQGVVAEFRAAYGDRLVTGDCRRVDGTTGVHFSPGGDRVGLGLEVMRDAYSAAACDEFLGYAFSNVSCMVEHLRDWPAGSVTLVGDYLQQIRNVYMHLDPATRARLSAGQMG
jgi:hypothetical protein